MRIEFAPEYRLQVLRAEAESRGLLGRLQSVAAAREADGLDALDAELDAADSLGLSGEVNDLLELAAEPLAGLGVEKLILDDAHAGMPTLRRDETFAHFAHDPSTAEQLARTLGQLWSQFEVDPPGPLFEPRPR